MPNPRLFLSKKKIVWVLLAVMAIVFLTFSPCLKNGFLNWDDTVHLTENQSIRLLDREHLAQIFQKNINKTYIPLTTLSFALEYKFFGDNPFPYHLDNVLLHLLVVLLIFLLAFELGLSTVGAGVAALLFGIHPMHVESVAWVTERKDVLYSVFYMLALLGYGKYLRHRGVSCWPHPERSPRGIRGGAVEGSISNLFYCLSLAAGTLSMLAKPMAISLPLILLLCDWFAGRRWTKVVFFEKIPHFLFLGILAWLTYREHVRIPGDGFFEGILIWIWTFVFYLRQFFFPGVLMPIYHLPRPIEIFQLDYGLAVVIFVLILAVLFGFRRQRRLIFAVLFYFLSIFFLLRFDDAADINVVADRFMYLPSLGICLWVGFCGEKLWTSVPAKKSNVSKIAIVSVFILVAAVLSFRSFVQCKVWKNSLMLWRYQLLFHPHTPIALNNLANAIQDEPAFRRIEEEYRKILELRKEGMSDEQIKISPSVVHKIESLQQLYAKAIELDPQYVDAYYNWAKINQDIGKAEEAIELYHKTLSLNPGYKDAYFNLGRLYQQENDADKAVWAYNQTIQTDPENPDLYINVIKSLTEAFQKDQAKVVYAQAREKMVEDFRSLARLNKESEVFYANLGDVYQQLKDYHSAKAAYEMALDIHPHYINALNNLGNTYAQMGELGEAIFLFQKVLGMNPRDFYAHLNLGAVYSRLEDYPKAIEFYEKAIRINPQDAEAYFQAGFIYELNGQAQKAIEHYQKTIKLKPDDTEAYYNLGNVYASLNSNVQATAAYLKAIEMNPSHVNAFVNLSILYSREKDYEQAIKYCDEARVLGWDVPKEYLVQLERYRK